MGGDFPDRAILINLNCVNSVSLVQKPETRLKNTKRVKASSQKSQCGVMDLKMES